MTESLASRMRAAKWEDATEEVWLRHMVKIVKCAYLLPHLGSFARKAEGMRGNILLRRLGRPNLSIRYTCATNGGYCVCVTCGAVHSSPSPRTFAIASCTHCESVELSHQIPYPPSYYLANWCNNVIQETPYYLHPKLEALWLESIKS